MFQLFALAMPHHEANKIRSDIEFFQALRKALVKRTAVSLTGTFDPDISSVVRELISKSIAAEGVIDIFAMKDKAKPDISIFDEKFLEEVRNMRFKNLAIDALRKLLRDELALRMRRNLVRYKSLMELLEEIIEEYEDNIINSAKVIERLIKLAREIKAAEKAGEGLGLSEEETAFYDVMAIGRISFRDDEQLKGLVKELVRLIRRDLTVDWTQNDIIKSKIRANVRLLLLRRGVPQEESEKILDLIYQQAQSLYRDYVPVLS